MPSRLVRETLGRATRLSGAAHSDSKKLHSGNIVLPPTGFRKTIIGTPIVTDHLSKGDSDGKENLQLCFYCSSALYACAKMHGTADCSPSSQTTRALHIVSG